MSKTAECTFHKRCDSCHVKHLGAWMTVKMVYRLAGSVGGGSVPSLRDDESPEGGSIDGTGEVKNRKESSSKE